ncbi:hypothetical protein [Rheinheimera nanhaiensis]|uniref:hypothetical protein n=1 Tax=Rheinheimera nanhaiensis TaxID=1163621 RepID=UPI00130EAA84|nr:hypothetical protein [Rheinheimera nanhaiensis]
MRKLISILIVVFATSAYSGEWVELPPANFGQLEIVEQNTFSFADEGVYIKHKSEYPFSSSLSCSKKQFVAFVEPKLADRALSVVMMAIATSKTVKFYVDGCTHDYPKAVSIMLVP